MKLDQRFRARDRLRAEADFARVYALRCRQGDGRLLIYVAENDLAWSRLGLSVSKQAGNAVRRNYIRRRIREAFRTGRDELPAGLDIVCVVRRGAAAADYDVCGGFRRLVSRAARRLRGAGGAQSGPSRHVLGAE